MSPGWSRSDSLRLERSQRQGKVYLENRSDSPGEHTLKQNEEMEMLVRMSNAILYRGIADLGKNCT